MTFQTEANANSTRTRTPKIGIELQLIWSTTACLYQIQFISQQFKRNLCRNRTQTEKKKKKKNLTMINGVEEEEQDLDCVDSNWRKLQCEVLPGPSGAIYASRLWPSNCLFPFFVFYKYSEMEIDSWLITPQKIYDQFNTSRIDSV